MSDKGKATHVKGLLARAARKLVQEQAKDNPSAKNLRHLNKEVERFKKEIKELEK